MPRKRKRKLPTCKAFRDARLDTFVSAELRLGITTLTWNTSESRAARHDCRL